VSNQIPLLYRREYLLDGIDIYEESEYEFNHNLVLKKIASMLLTLATRVEPPTYRHMC
jgi:hypothetical protein